MAKSKKDQKTETKTQEEINEPRLVIMGDDPLAIRMAGWYLNELQKHGRQEDQERVEKFVDDVNKYRNQKDG